MRRALLIAAIVALLTVAASTLALVLGDRVARGQVVPGVTLPPVPAPPPVVPGQPAPPVPQQLVLNVGDTIRVAGADIGCQVTNRAARPTIECRRVTPTRGTYGTFISERTAVVARFRSAATAQVVFTAKQLGGWRACRASAGAARVSRAARGGCR